MRSPSYRRLHSTGAKYKLFSSIHEIVTKANNIHTHTTNFNKILRY
jgi:hypothetical protein